MNIKISKEEYDYLKKYFVEKHIIGSYMYGNNNIHSDNDYLCILGDSFTSDSYLPNYHQLQYDDTENNIQYNITNISKFYTNLFSGDATINADIFLFGKYRELYTEEELLCILRNYNIIKAFIGFAKRDIKYFNKGKNKIQHIHRGLVCAEFLLNNKVPNKEDILNIQTNDLSYYSSVEETIRRKLNDQFNLSNINRYFTEVSLLDRININKIVFDKESIIYKNIEKKIINSNNIKEFRY